jgi:hypothetical protein
MVIARDRPAHRPDVGIAGAGAVAAAFNQFEGMPRTRQEAMVGA